jgi:hypothetical protein
MRYPTEMGFQKVGGDDDSGQEVVLSIEISTHVTEQRT